MHIEAQAQDLSTSNNPSATVDPYLPPELERLIFELAAHDIGPKGSATLLLVAKRVHGWWVLYLFDIIIKKDMNELKIYRIRPLIFRVFNLMTRPPYPDFKKFPQLLESIGYLAKQLLVGYNPIQGYLETLLSFCPNIMDLAIWVFRIKSMFPILDKLPLRRLCANFDDFAYEDFLARPFFVNLTHLEIFTFMGETWDGNYEALVHLPTLTHLLIRCSIEVKLIPQLLRQCRPLRILIISPVSTRRYLQRDSAEERLAEINDYRLVFLESPSFASLVDDWDKGAHGGIDCWAFGELVFLAQSRASFSSFMIRDNLLEPFLDNTGNYFVDPSPRYFPRIGFVWKKHLNEKGLEWFEGLHLHDPWHK